jgi:hypothetical protein
VERTTNHEHESLQTSGKFLNIHKQPQKTRVWKGSPPHVTLLKKIENKENEIDKHGVPPTKRLFLFTESHELDSIPELIRPWGEQMERTTGTNGDARVKNGILTPSGVKRRNDGISIEWVKNSDGKSNSKFRITGGLGG